MKNTLDLASLRKMVEAAEDNEWFMPANGAIAVASHGVIGLPPKMLLSLLDRIERAEQKARDEESRADTIAIERDELIGDVERIEAKNDEARDALNSILVLAGSDSEIGQICRRVLERRK